MTRATSSGPELSSQDPAGEVLRHDGHIDVIGLQRLVKCSHIFPLQFIEGTMGIGDFALKERMNLERLVGAQIHAGELATGLSPEFWAWTLSGTKMLIVKTEAERQSNAHRQFRRLIVTSAETLRIYHQTGRPEQEIGD